MTNPALATRPALKLAAAPTAAPAAAPAPAKEAAQAAGITADTTKAPKAKPAPKAAPKVVTKKAGAKGTGKTTRKADKPAAKVKAEAKPKVTKPAKEVVAFVARSVKPGASIFAIAQDARPVSGIRLFAHTHAALTLLGMMNNGRPAVTKSAVLTLMGQRALTYHMAQTNFESAPDQKVRLSISGFNKFKARVTEGLLDGKLANAFMTLFIDGKAAQETGVAQGNVYAAKFA